MKRIFILMMLMSIALVSCKNEKVNAPKPTTFPTTEEAYDTKLSLYGSFPTTSEDVVFAGDEFFEYGHWSELFASQNIKNRGIAFETADGLRYRIASVAKGSPESIFIHTGYNDLAADKSADEVYEVICDIVKIAKQVSPKTKLFVTNIIKLSPDSEFNEQIDKLNNLIETKAKEYTFVDAVSKIADENGVIADSCFDQFRLLSERGFSIVAESIKGYVDVTPQEINSKNTIVMFGGDVMAQIDWSELVGKNEVINRANGSDIISVVAARLNSFVEFQPAKVFIMIPKIDINGMETDALWNTYKGFAKNFKATFRNTQLYFVSNIPNSDKSIFYLNGDYNAKLQEINKLMDAGQSENGFLFLDPAVVLADEKGNLKADLTYDGENLNAEGLLTFATMMMDGPRMVVFPTAEEMIGIN